jgi:hypothetical protein
MSIRIASSLIQRGQVIESRDRRLPQSPNGNGRLSCRRRDVESSNRPNTVVKETKAKSNESV